MSSLKAEHRASIERLEHDHEAVLEVANAHYNELYCDRNHVVDRLNESHSQQLKKLKADSEAKLADAFEHTRHDREYIAQIDVLEEKIMKQQETIQFDAQGIRQDAEMIAGLRSQLAEFEDKMADQGAELKRQQDSAHEHLGSFLDVYSELITTQWAVTQLEKDLEKAHAITAEKNTVIDEKRSQHHRINHYLTTSNSNLRRQYAALIASCSAKELVLSNSHLQEREDLKKEYEVEIALLRKSDR